MKSFFEERSFSLVLTMLYTFTALAILLQFTEVSVHVWAVILFAVLWITLMELCRHKNVAWMPVIIFALAFIYCSYKMQETLLEPFFYQGEEELTPTVSSDISVMLFVALASMLIEVVVNRDVLRTILVAGWLAFWIASVFIPIELSKITVVLMLPSVLYELSRLIYISVKGNRKELFDRLRVPLLGFFIAGSIFMMILPTSSEPYHWRLPRTIAEAVTEMYQKLETAIITKTSSSTEYGMGFNGLDVSSALMGTWDEESATTIKLAVSETPSGRVYLRGNAWETFDGSSWSTSISDLEESSLSVQSDTAEHLYALWRYEGDYEYSDFFKENAVGVLYNNTKTRTMFSVLNERTISIDSDEHPWGYYPTGLRFSYVEESVKYTIGILEENRRSIGDLIEYSEGWTYGERNLSVHWYSISTELRSFTSISAGNISQVEKFFAERQQLIYDTYLSVPDFVSDEVYELAHEITADCETNYEKLLAIQSYLSSNYRYSTTPETQDTDNFLDWFLFEADEGYCTWFATAASILARCEGIPSRYVQGYCVRLSEDETYLVTAEDAHAWSECYIDGYGWVTVEATPGYSAGGFWLTSLDTFTDSYDEELYEEELDYGMGGGAATGDRDEEPEEAEEEIVVEEESSNFATVVVAVLFVILVTGAVIIAIVYDKKILSVKRVYDASSYAERAAMDFEMIEYLARRTGVRRRNDDTIEVFLVRLSRYLGNDIRRTRALSVIYDRVFFGGEEITEEEWQESRWLLESLQKKLKERLLFWKK